jgi:hypothetical protein
VLPESAALTVDQVVAIYDGAETSADLTAAHAACDSASHTFNDHDRGRLVGAMVGAISRVSVWRAPKCAACG